MNILITGGAGFIGSHLCDVLLQEESNVVTVLDNMSLGNLGNIQHLTNTSRFTLVKGDILEDSVLADIFKTNRFDIVFHLAANSDIAVSHAKPSVDLDNTFMTTFKVLNAMKEHNVKNIVFASTSAIYGDPENKKLTEDFGPLLPVSHYGAGKLASEAFISSFVENYNMQAWIVRFPNVVGERATHGAIFDFIRKAQNNAYLEVLGNGEQNKPYVYVKDLVAALVYVWQNSYDKINIYNVGVETRTKVKDIAKIVLEELNSSKEIQFTGGKQGWIGDVPEFQYDLTKIHELGWAAKLTSDESVRKAVQEILKLQKVVSPDI